MMMVVLSWVVQNRGCCVSSSWKMVRFHALLIYKRLSMGGNGSAPGHWESGQTSRMASQMWLK